MKKFHAKVMTTLVGVGLVSGVGVPAADVRITADHLNLRSGPNAQSEVVGDVRRGRILKAGEPQGEWLPVSAPDDVEVWVFGQLIRDGKASVSPVIVRAGPGINYREVGRLQKGDKVTARGASSSGEWLKIAPPAGCVLWINIKYAEVIADGDSSEAAEPRVVRKPPTANSVRIDEPKPGVSVSSSPVGEPSVRDLPAGLDSKRLAEREGQGKIAQYEGVLGPAGWVWNRPSKYRLIKTDAKGHIVSACYVLGSDSTLSVLKGKTLTLRGAEYWLKGVAYPVVSPQQIVPKE